jgi:RimJ/RimL family protein N-acetyltransferase
MSGSETLTSPLIPELIELPGVEGIYLRPTRIGDAEECHQVISQDQSPSLAKYQYWTDEFTPENVESRIAKIVADMTSGKAMQYKIVDKSSDQEHLVGEVGLYRYGQDPTVASLGFLVIQSHEGKGIVSASSRQIIELGFSLWGLKRITLGIEEGNTRSERLIEKIGAHLTGKVEKDKEADGRIHELRTWEITRE